MISLWGPSKLFQMLSNSDCEMSHLIGAVMLKIMYPTFNSLLFHSVSLWDNLFLGQCPTPDVWPLGQFGSKAWCSSGGLGRKGQGCDFFDDVLCERPATALKSN